MLLTDSKYRDADCYTRNVGSTANSTANTGPGFSEVALAAALNGGLTTANTPTTDNSLGLDIE